MCAHARGLHSPVLVIYPLGNESVYEKHAMAAKGMGKQGSVLRGKSSNAVYERRFDMGGWLARGRRETSDVKHKKARRDTISLEWRIFLFLLSVSCMDEPKEKETKKRAAK